MMIPPISIDTVPSEPRTSFQPSGHAAAVDGVEPAQNTLFSGTGSLFDQLQVSLLGGMGYTPPDDFADTPNDSWGFNADSPAGQTRRTHGNAMTAMRLLRMQRDLDRWSEATTALSNIAKSVTDSIRTLTQDR